MSLEHTVPIEEEQTRHVPVTLLLFYFLMVFQKLTLNLTTLFNTEYETL